MISKEKKKQIIESLSNRVKEAKAVYFADYSGLKTPEMTQLRQDLRKLIGQAQVAKKTLAEIAFKKLGYKKDKIPLAGSLVLSFAFEEPIGVAKAIKNFADKNEKFQILGGLLEGSFLGREEVERLAKIPSKEILLSQLLGSMNSPIQRLTFSLEGNIQKLLFCLNALKEKNKG